MFNQGDKIFYPMHGAGHIDKIEEKDILGEKVKYYIIKMPGEVTVMVPQERAESLGLRPLVSEKEAKDVLNVLLEGKSEMPERWNERYSTNKEIMKTGDIFQLADIYRNLSYRNLKKNLSTSEKKMLLNSKQILLSELSETMSVDFDVLDEKLRDKFETTFTENEATVNPIAEK